jgi:hypothetical protein
LKKLNKHQQDLIAFVSATAEKAKEDLAIGYFRSIFKKFTRQKEAKQADGYVPGNVVLELKGKTSDWYAGFFQGLAYGRELDFAKVVVIANDFLALWYLPDIDDALIEAAQTEEGAPNAIGKRLAKKFKNKKNEVLKSSTFNLDPLYLPSKESIFSSDSTYVGK